MALNATVAALDDVPEAAREFYVEREGAFVLNVEGIDAHPTVANLKSAFERQKGERTTFKAEADKLRERLAGLPEDFSADMFEEIRAKAEAKGDDKGDADRLAQVRKQLETKHAAEISALNEALNAERAMSTGMLVDEGLTKALVDSGVKKELLRGAHAMLKGMVKVAEEDGKRAAIVETDMGPLPLAKFVGEWASGPEGSAFVAPPAGGGAGGSRSPGGKTLKRAEFDKMDPASQRAKIAEGATLID